MAKSQKVSNISTIKNVYLYYTRVNEPMLTKDANDKGIKINPKDPNANCEYVVKIAVAESTFKKMKKKWRGVSNFPKAKEYTIAEFEKAFHNDNDDMPDFGNAEDVVVIKFAQKAKIGGKDAKKIELIGIKGKVQDTNGESIKQSTLLGNGTKAHLQVRFVEYKDYSPYLYPQAICVVELVKYENASTEVDYDSFGIEDLDVEEFDDEFDDVSNEDNEDNGLDTGMNADLDEESDDIPW